MRHDTAFDQARRSLLLDHCFFGSLVMHLEPVEDPGAPRALWVDGERVGFNPKALEAMDLRTRAGLLAKGVLHCTLGHHLRRGTRDPKLWQEAVDLVTNPHIIASGLSLPAGAKNDPAYANRFAEEVYDELQQAQQNRPEPQGGGGGQNPSPGSGQPGGAGQGQQPGQGGPTGAAPGKGNAQAPAGGQNGPQAPQTGEVRDLPAMAKAGAAAESERIRQSEEWKVRMVQALTAAQGRGDLPGTLQRMVKAALETRTDWRAELRRFFQALARDEATWNQPNRRFISQGLYLPALHSEKMGTMVIGLDSSGSTSSAMPAFLNEVNQVIEDVRPERVIVIHCDAEVHKVEEFTTDDLPLEIKVEGGGGTDFRPVFDWVEQEGIDPACLIYLTDLDGSFPNIEPPYPTLWAACGRKAEAPFGDVLKIDTTQREGDLFR